MDAKKKMTKIVKHMKKMTKFLNNSFELINFVIFSTIFVILFSSFCSLVSGQPVVGNVMIAPRFDNQDGKANALQCCRILV